MEWGDAATRQLPFSHPPVVHITATILLETRHGILSVNLLMSSRIANILCDDTIIHPRHTRICLEQRPGVLAAEVPNEQQVTKGASVSSKLLNSNSHFPFQVNI